MKTLIIGAGPGGLAVAVNLAGLGAHVVVVEKEAVPGGRMRGLTFGSQGEYRVDTGPSIMQLPQLLERIFRRSGLRIEDYVTLQRLDVNTRVCFWDGTHLDTTWDQPGMQAEVERLVPGKGGAYRRWFLAKETSTPLPTACSWLIRQTPSRTMPRSGSCQRHDSSPGRRSTRTSTRRFTMIA